jgi:hypothetical protein
VPDWTPWRRGHQTNRNLSAREGGGLASIANQGTLIALEVSASSAYAAQFTNARLSFTEMAMKTAQIGAT